MLTGKRRMTQRRQLLRAILFCILICLVLVLIFYNSTSHEIQEFENAPILTEKKKEVNVNSQILTEDEDEKLLQKLEILKLGGDSANLSKRDDNFRQDLGACKIPKLDVNGAEVIKFYKKFPLLDCEDEQPKPWAYIDEQRKIQPTERAKQIGLDKIQCQWAFYDRIDDGNLHWTDEKSFTFGAKIEEGDYLKVTCQTDSEKWTNPFMVVVPNEERVKQLRMKRKHHNVNRTMNVYILSFDSLSQMSFRRNLPKTVKFLEEDMDFTVFNGYNIVGDGTPQAFIPILTGQTEVELPLTRKRYPSARYVDDAYPFVWNNFSEAGYATLYGEDDHGLGTFTYRLKGFRKKPTDHFPVTFFHYTEKLKRPKVCIGAEKQHNVWFRYIESFWREYGQLSLPRFSLMHHSCLSHDDINRVQLVDEDLLMHLQKMQELGTFEDSLVILMADHGARFSELRQTHQGQLEERLPFVSIYLPKIIDKQYQLAWENLRKNAFDRLVTPFDFYATLMDVLRWPLPIDELKLPNPLPIDTDGTMAKQSKSPPNRSLSFFREIPLNRTCDQAGIEAHWCTCLAWQPLTDSSESGLLSKAVVKLINDYTEPERAICAQLKMDKVLSAKKLVPNENLLKYSGTLDKDGFKPELKGKVTTKFATYQIVFQTKPGNAKYEVTLFYDGHQVTVDWATISHINKFGDTPHCIIDRNYFMASYCVCYDKITAA